MGCQRLLLAACGRKPGLDSEFVLAPSGCSCVRTLASRFSGYMQSACEAVSSVEEEDAVSLIMTRLEEEEVLALDPTSTVTVAPAPAPTPVIPSRAERGTSSYTTVVMATLAAFLIGVLV